MAENDISKLPKWAQNKIHQAEQSAQYWRDKIQDGEKGDTEVWVQYYPRSDRGLPPGSVISFKIYNEAREERGRYDVSMTDHGSIEVRGVGFLMMDQLRTIHKSSNAFEIELIPWEDSGIK